MYRRSASDSRLSFIRSRTADYIHTMGEVTSGTEGLRHSKNFRLFPLAVFLLLLRIVSMSAIREGGRDIGGMPDKASARR